VGLPKIDLWENSEQKAKSLKHLPKIRFQSFCPKIVKSFGNKVTASRFFELITQRL